MAKFREFYVPAGAGSNFLAKQCLWTSQESKEFNPYDSSQNEFFIDRVKSDAKVMSYGIRNPDTTARFETVSKTLISPAKYYECPDQSIISESIKIKSILIEINKWFRSLSNKYADIDTDIEDRNMVINNCDHIWREEFSVWTNSFFEKIHWIPSTERPNSISDKIREIEDYFAKCREYYYDECERNNWDVFQICHTHPYLSISPRLKLPENIVTMAIELDGEMNMYNNALIDIKMYDRINPDIYSIIQDDDGKPKPPEDIFINNSVAISNKKVSFRKIYFENNEDEIRKMYDFFDNEDYFDENRVQIMSEFKEYHDDNMKLVQKLAPNLLEQIKSR